MRKLNLFYIGLVLIAMQACTGNAKEDDDTVSVKPPVKIEVPLDRDDAQFALQANNSALTEIAMGKLAIKKGLDKRVKNFGAMMVKDHTKWGDKLQAIAKVKKITLPTTIDSASQKAMDDLDKDSGTAFDKAYLNNMIKDHEANIKLFQAATKQLMDADLRQYANKNLLIFKRHLDAIHGIKGGMK